MKSVKLISSLDLEIFNYFDKSLPQQSKIAPETPMEIENEPSVESQSNIQGGTESGR